MLVAAELGKLCRLLLVDMLSSTTMDEMASYVSVLSETMVASPSNNRKSLKLVVSGVLADGADDNVDVLALLSLRQS